MAGNQSVEGVEGRERYIRFLNRIQATCMIIDLAQRGSKSGFTSKNHQVQMAADFCLDSIAMALRRALLVTVSDHK